MTTIHTFAVLGALVVAALGGNTGAAVRDPTFGNNGLAMNTPAEVFESAGQAIVVQTDGKIVVAGSCPRSSTFNNSDYCVWRFEANGQADLGFGTAGMTITPVPDVYAGPERTELDGAGNIYVAGRQSCSRSLTASQVCQVVLRYTSTGQLDTGFNGTGFKVISASEEGASLTGAKLAVRPDGRILLAGVCHAGPAAGLCLLGLQPDGTPDRTMGVNGVRDGAIEIGSVSAVRIGSNGTIKIIAQCQIDGTRLCISHHLADGSADTSYGPKGIVVSSIAQGFFRSTFTDDGRAIGVELCAPVLQIPPRVCVSRLTAIGNTDMSFANGAIQSVVFDEQNYLSVGAVVALDDDMILTLGTCRSDSVSAQCFARFTALGEVDTSFGPGGTQFEPGQSGTLAAVRHQNGRVISVGDCRLRGNGGTYRSQMCLMAIQAMTRSESSTRPAIEYRNAALDYYFLTSRKSEQDALDAAPGWSRTGNAFRVLANSTKSTRPLVRFYFDQIAKNRSRGLHFYTPLELEIDLVQSLNAGNGHAPRLPFNEGIDAFVYPASEDSQCGAGTTPVYRAFRGNARFPDNPNHRFTTDVHVYSQLVRDGWDAEGVKFCAPV